MRKKLFGARLIAVRSMPRAGACTAATGIARHAQAAGRHLGRPIVVRPVRRIPAAVHRRARAARDRDGVPQRLPEPCRDRDLPRPFDHPDRHSSGAHRDHRQHLVRPVDRPLRQDRLLRRGREPVPGTSSTAYKVSPAHLRVPTLGELMKRNAPASRNVAVAGKDRSAVMMSGQRPDQRWYLDRHAVRDRPRGAAVPQSRRQGQCASRATGLAAERPPLEPPPLCAGQGARSRRSRAAASRSATAASRAGAGDASGLPRLARIRRRHARARRRADPGNAARPRAAPDVLSIGLPATDYVGHSLRHRRAGNVPAAAVARPRARRFLRRLDSRGIDYAVALTADHGGQDIPERERLAGVPDARASIRRSRRATSARRWPRSSSCLSGPGLMRRGQLRRHVYRSGASAHRSAPSCCAPRSRPTARTRRCKRCSPPGRSRDAAAERARPKHWTLLQRSVPAFDSSARAISTSSSSRIITPIADTSRYVATHGSPWDYDRRVPILFWRPGIQGARRSARPRPIDIMPTLAGDDWACRSSASVDRRPVPRRRAGIVCAVQR